MTDAPIPLTEQLLAVEMAAIGVRDILERATAKKIHRPPEWITTKARQLAALRAAYATIKQVQKLEAGK